MNGCGKSTLGKALAADIGYRFIDSEDLYFPKTDSDYMFSSPRSAREAEELLMKEIAIEPRFVFASVAVKSFTSVIPHLKAAFLMEVPREVRLRRVRVRSEMRFGGRVVAGGDLREREEQFFVNTASRDDSNAREQAKLLTCPVFTLDGEADPKDNIRLIKETADKLLCSEIAKTSCGFVMYSVRFK